MNANIAKDIFQKCKKFLEEKVTPPREANLYPFFYSLESQQDAVVRMRGKELIMLGSNNYLSLTNDQRVIETGVEALRKFGSGVSGSRLLNGTTVIHEQLEKELASFFHKEDCVILSTGYSANLSFLSTIAGRDEIILCDRENHASIYDGIKLGNGQLVRYYHNDMADLENKLKEIENIGKVIVTDGVFSMSGDICKLDEIVKLAKKYNARVMIDDAHGIGVLGKHGRGTAEFFGLEDNVDVIMGTFSKSLGSVGGFIVGPHDVIEYLKHLSRPFIFCAALPPINIACAQKSLEIIKEENWRFEKLLEMSRYAKKVLVENHIRILNPDTPTPIIALISGSELRTLAIFKILFNNGVFVNPVVPPAAPGNESIIRLSLQTNHTKDLIDKALKAIISLLHSLPNDDEKIKEILMTNK